MVAGAPGTGKTNLLQAAVLSAAGVQSPQALRVLLVDFSGRSLRALESLKHVVARVTDISALDAQLSLLEVVLTQAQSDMPRTVIVIDDYDATSETLLASGGQTLKRLRDLARLPNEAGVHFWVAGYMERSGDPLLRQLLLHRSGFGLCSRESLAVFGLRTNQLPAEMMPEGRAYFAEHNQIAVVQTALVENAALTVNRLNQQVWGEYEPASLTQSISTPTTVPVVGAGFIPPASPQDTPETLPPLEIDTAGLIADLMNASPLQAEEKKSGSIDPPPKTRKRRGKKAAD